MKLSVKLGPPIDRWDLGFKIINWGLLFVLLLLSTLTLNPLQSSSQTQWYKYPGNPIFKTGNAGEWDRNIFST